MNTKFKNVWCQSQYSADVKSFTEPYVPAQNHLFFSVEVWNGARVEHQLLSGKGVRVPLYLCWFSPHPAYAVVR